MAGARSHHGFNSWGSMFSRAGGSWLDHETPRPCGRSVTGVGGALRARGHGERKHSRSDTAHPRRSWRHLHRHERWRTRREIAEVVRADPFEIMLGLCHQFDSGHTTIATETATPAPHTPQTALTSKMIAVAMHALPSSLALAPRRAISLCLFSATSVRPRMKGTARPRGDKWGAGAFGQLEEVFRGFQFTPQPARWINHVRPLLISVRSKI
jgi:hypothetical protein